MSDYKGGYSTNASKMKKQSESNKSLSKIRKNAEKRSHTHRESWQKVNLNDVVSKFTPGVTPYNDGGKFIYSNDRYRIVADTYGGYLRIEDKSLPGRSRYITLEGKPYYSLPKSSRERLTHYYILKREEM